VRARKILDVGSISVHSVDEIARMVLSIWGANGLEGELLHVEGPVGLSVCATVRYLVDIGKEVRFTRRSEVSLGRAHGKSLFVGHLEKHLNVLRVGIGLQDTSEE
jgi:hypothetical protein